VRISGGFPSVGPTEKRRRFMPRPSKTDGDRLKKMTEEEVVRNALADPDAQPTDAAFWREAEVRQPVRKVSVG